MHCEMSKNCNSLLVIWNVFLQNLVIDVLNKYSFLHDDRVRRIWNINDHVSIDCIFEFRWKMNLNVDVSLLRNFDFLEHVVSQFTFSIDKYLRSKQNVKIDYVSIRIESFVKRILVDVKSTNLLQNQSCWSHFECDHCFCFDENL